MLNLLFIFSLYSVLGWVLEVLYFFFKSGKYVKRGLLDGPYCPLYGFSIASCEMVSKYLNNNLFLMFIVFSIICTGYEFITALFFDKILKVKMWDYSNVKTNLNGYICVKFSLIWGLLSIISVKILNPIFLSDSDKISSFIKALFTIGITSIIALNAILYKRTEIKR